MTEDDSSKGPNNQKRLGHTLWSELRANDFVRDIAVGAVLVLVVGVLLFGVSGVWPPLVAVESGSMEPHMSKGDLVFVMEEHRLPAEVSIARTGVATYQTAATHKKYRKFGAYGDVIVFDSNGDGGTPVIHRAHFWVNDSENWYGKANPDYLDGSNCEAIANCPAPHAGFITKGDYNPTYDQVEGRSGPVRPSWIRGTAEVRIPLLGHVRLVVSNWWTEIAS